MSDSLNFSLRLTADGSAFVGQVRVAREEIDRLKRSAGEADRGSAQMGASMTRAAALGAAAGTMLADGLVQVVKATIEAFTQTVRLGEAFSNLAASTGSSVEAMSRQANAAEIGGASFEQYQSVLLKVARSLNGVDQESTKAQKALAFLGITTKDPAEALQQLAVKLDQYADGASKVALVNDILGRDGARMIPMLNDIARSQGVAASVTAEQARVSENLAREWRRLLQEGDAWRRWLVTSAAPAMIDFLEQLREGIRIAGGFWRALQLFGTMNPFKSTAENLAEVRAQLDAARQPGKEYDPVTRNYVDSAPNQEQIRRLEQQLEYLKLRQRQEITAALGGETFGDQNDRLNRKRDSGYVGDKKGLEGAGDKVDEYTKLIDKLNQKLAATDAQLKATFSGEQLVPAQRELEELMASEAWKKLAEPQKLEIIAKYDTLIQAQQAVRDFDADAKGAAKTAAEIKKEFDEWTAAQERAYRGALSAADDFIAQLELETRTMGMTSTERQRYIVLMQLQAQMEQRAGESAEDYAARLDEVRKRIASINAAFGANESAKALQESLAQQKAMWKSAYDDISNTLTDAFMRAFSDIRNAGRYLKDALAQLFQNWVIRPIIQASLSGMSGGMASIFAGFNGGGAGGINPLALLSGGGGGFSPLAFFGGGMSPFIEGTASFMGPLAEGAGLLTGLMSTAASFIPYIGIALAGASALGLFERDPSQVRGRFDVSAGTGGFEDNAYTRTRFGNIGFEDSGTQYFSGEAAQVFNQVIAGALDAIASRLTPEQISRVSTKLQGIDFKGEEGTYTTQDFIEKYGADILKQVISVALEELNPAMASLIANFKGTADETVTFANALLALNDALTGDVVDEANTAWTTATSSIIDQLAKQRDEVIRLANEYDGSVEATTALANATTTYKNAVVQTLVAIKRVAAEMTSAIDGAREHLETQGLSQQALYDYYQSKGDTYVTALDAATTPEAVQALGNQAIQAMIRAFDMLPEEAQNTRRDEFLANLQKLQDLINARLAEITAGVTDGADDPFQAVEDALSAAATKFENGATTIDKGATTIQSGADNLANAAAKFVDAVAKFAATKLEVDVNVNVPSQVGGQA